jgi:glycosyltransferase involved in cell wall biosynthesis
MNESVNLPRISVIVPSYNQGQYVEETILSVIGQNYPDLEVIVIDGGSTDNTVQVLEKYSKYLSYWHSKQDKGQGDAVNQGMRMSSGDILCWLNSDDVYLAGTLLDIGKRLYRIVDQCHLVYGAALTMNQSGETMEGGSVNGAPFDLHKLTYLDYVVQPSAFWTRKLWQRTGELNTGYRYVLDWEWFIRASKISGFEYIPRFYSVFRYHSLHKTSNGGAERRAEIIDVVKRFSSDYWIQIYEEVERAYPQIIGMKNSLEHWGIPRVESITRFFFSRVHSRKIKNPGDFQTVWRMIGSRQV